MTYAYKVLPVIEYDGTNGQEICDAWAATEHYEPDTWTIETEADGTLVVDYATHEDGGPGVNHVPITFQTGDRLVGNTRVSAADFSANWRTVN
jgi:hypothetical protein